MCGMVTDIISMGMYIKSWTDINILNFKKFKNISKIY